MRTHAIVSRFAVAGAASVLLTACTHGDKGDAAVDTKPVTIGSLMGAPDDEDVDWAARQQQQEEAVATCMIAQGWEYIPVRYPYPPQSVENSDEDTVARIKREGLGVTYYLLNDGPGGLVVTAPLVGFVDPNQDYVNSLDEAERKAYYGSLSGTEEEQAAAATTVVDPETGEETQAYGNLGCQLTAQDEVNGVDVTTSPRYWESVKGYYDELQQRTESDARVVKLNASWSACMHKAGFDYPAVQNFWETAQAEFQARADEVLGPDFYKDPMDGWSQAQMDDFWATKSQDEVNTFFSKSSRLTDGQRSQLEAILADEVPVALAENSCAKDFTDKTQDIYSQIEEQYALEHGDELKALAAALANAG